MKIKKICSKCGKEITITLKGKGRYKTILAGGYYLGKFPVKPYPRPRHFIEVWECPECYGKRLETRES